VAFLRSGLLAVSEGDTIKVEYNPKNTSFVGISPIRTPTCSRDAGAEKARQDQAFNDASQAGLPRYA